MRSKFIVSFLLVICCLIASVPVSADVTPRAIICDQCGPYINADCHDVYENETKHHTFVYQGAQKTCYYVYVRAYTFEECAVCGQGWVTGLHVHGQKGHIQPYCGTDGYFNSLYCPIDNFTYPVN